MTVHAKDIGHVRKHVLEILNWLSRPRHERFLHWALYIDGKFFELKRISGMAAPVLGSCQF
jgi:hypothetical protein